MDSELLKKTYQQKTDKEHILHNPDTYIGSVETTKSHEWIFRDGKIISEDVDINLGLIKLFDEGIVNCRDHYIRMKSETGNHQVTTIQIGISPDGTITLENDGNGIDVVKHPEYDIWIPELIFGHLRTSTNYNKDEKKIVGGKNGFGFKLVLIWSTFGTVETVDHVRQLKYVQEFSNNLETIEAPKITKCTTKPFTKVSFKPDYARLGLSCDGLSPDMLALFEKRIYDIGAVTDSSVKIKYNGKLIPVKTFINYLDLYVSKTHRVYESTHERWEYAVSLWDEFKQVSFVNGICTSKGGKHVDYILGQITKKLVAWIEKKKKIDVNPAAIRDQLFLFIRCDIENPSFDSQSKDFLTTPALQFGSKCVVSDAFIEKLSKIGIVEKACEISAIKESKQMKKQDGIKSKSVRGIPKLLDANWAGTDKSSQCILIFCEGDSAKAGIVSGLSSSDRNVIGVYPMKGKMLNVRGESATKISENKEIVEIKKILGLEKGKQYESMEDIHKSLRYSKIVYMTDQDLDGSHIKGLGINFFHHEWPSLLKLPNFIAFMNTPILKAKKGAQSLSFFSEQEYQKWKLETPSNGWSIKYYKGLGTSTANEFREYFANKRFVGFCHTEMVTDAAIDLVFNKKKAHMRKDWLSTYSKDLYLETSAATSVTYEAFLNLEMIHFSKYDCERNIPNIMDGLKTSQRKIVFSAFKKKLNSEIKVAQFSGYISEHSGYHHGEASLNGAIISMAQTFVGSNNINLLLPNGQMGTRLRGGEDSASERYIFTQLAPITRIIFQEADDIVLNYISDDGQLVEPVFYAPIIPMILVNGTKGIGTGFSTEILCYNPMEIISYMKAKLLKTDDVETFSFIPFYKGFTGTITKVGEDKILIKGRYKRVATDKIQVFELPVGTWTYDFKELLEQLMEKTPTNASPPVKDYNDMSTDIIVDFTITFQRGKLDELESEQSDSWNGVEKLLKLYCLKSTTNMHLFDAQERLQKFGNVHDICDYFFDNRLQIYEKRKQSQLDEMLKAVTIAKNKMKYIQELLDGTIDLRNRKRHDILQMLYDKGYGDEGDELQYLLKMPMDMVSDENVRKTVMELQKLEAEYALLMSRSIEEIWLDELNALEKSLNLTRY